MAIVVVLAGSRADRLRLDRGAGAGRVLAHLSGHTDAASEWDLANFRVEMTGARGRDDVDACARCAVAQYALIRGYGFAHHMRTNVDQTGGVWRGDAVYTISASLPKGLKTIDAEVTARDCGAQGIPTI